MRLMDGLTLLLSAHALLEENKEIKGANIEHDFFMN